MSDPQQPRPPEDDPPSRTPNLFVLYGLLVACLLFAIACAAAIVWPFYHRR